jgi:O-antigen ligase
LPAVLSMHNLENRRSGNKFSSGLIALVIASALSFLAVHFLGYDKIPLVIVGIIGFSILISVSTKDPGKVALVWFFAMSGFHTTGMIMLPSMPDFSFARLFMVWVLFILLARIFVEGKKLKGPYLADFGFIAYAVYLLIQLSTHDLHQFHQWYLSTLTPVVAYLFAKNIFSEGRQISQFFWILVLPTLYFAVTAFGEHFGISAIVWPKKILDPSVGGWWEGRARGPFLQTAVFGYVLGMFALTQIYLITRPFYGKAIKAILAVSLTGAFMALFFTYTRGGWAATAIGLISLAVMRPKFRPFFIAAIVVGVMIFSVGLLQSTGGDELSERVSNTNTIENRLGVIAAASNMFLDHPLFGIGFFQFKTEGKEYMKGLYFPFYGYIANENVRHVVIHDIYVGRLAEEGLVGIILLLIYVIGVFKSFLLKWRFNPQEPWFNRDLLAIFMSVIILYLAGGMFIDLRFFDLPNTVPAFFAGLITGYGNDRYK